MDIPIIFEDDAILVINKPPGIIVNNADTVKEPTVQDWAAIKLGLDPHPPKQPRVIVAKGEERISTMEDFVGRAGIAHRIDKETSGILLIAKNLPAFIELQRQFKERIVKKTYLALVHGEVVPAEGDINAPIARLPWNKEHFGIVPGGKESITKYKVVKHITNEHLHEKMTLVEVHPETGRTHQIRVHFKYINYPLVGDYLYAGRKTSRDDREWAPRCMLHAHKITFLHPVSGENISLEAPIPEDMGKLIQ